MLFRTPLTAFICVLSFLYGSEFTVATPIIGSTRLQNLGPQQQPYTIKLIYLSKRSSAYQVVGGYNTENTGTGTGELDVTVPAIVKVVPPKPEKDDEEVENLKKVGLFLWTGIHTATGARMTVMRDVRTGFPKKGVSMKPFHEWYQKDKDMDILKNLKIIQATVKDKLMDYARNERIAHRDCHMANFFVTEDLKSESMPIDWAPTDHAARLRGVKPMKKEEDIPDFAHWLDQELQFLFSLNILSKELRRLGDRLLPEHAALLPEEQRRLNIERARIIAEKEVQKAGQ